MLDWRIDQPGDGPVRLALGGGTIDIGAMLAALPAGTPVETRIPIQCFVKAGGRLTAVGGPFRIDAGPGLGLTIRTVRFAETRDGDTCPSATR